MPGVVLSMSHTLHRKQGRYYYFHFTDGETEAPRGDGRDPGLHSSVARIGTLVV